MWLPFLCPPQTPLSGVGGRRGAVAGPLGGAPAQGAAAGLLRESDDDAAAATASAVKFMLIESEAAAPSASFQPRTAQSFFSSDQVSLSQPPPPPTAQPKAHAHDSVLGRATKRRREKKGVRGRNRAERERWTCTLRALCTDGDYDTQSRDRERLSVWLERRESEWEGNEWRKLEEESTRRKDGRHACLVCFYTHMHTSFLSYRINPFSFSFCLVTPLHTLQAWISSSLSGSMSFISSLHSLYSFLAILVKKRRETKCGQDRRRMNGR